MLVIVELNVRLVNYKWREKKRERFNSIFLLPLYINIYIYKKSAKQWRREKLIILNMPFMTCGMFVFFYFIFLYIFKQYKKTYIEITICWNEILYIFNFFFLLIYFLFICCCCFFEARLNFVLLCRLRRRCCWVILSNLRLGFIIYFNIFPLLLIKSNDEYKYIISSHIYVVNELRETGNQLK